MTDKKCPKCGSRSFLIIDRYETDYFYNVVDGVVCADGSGDDATHVRTTCVCDNCQHSWHPRKFDYTVDE